MLIRRPMDIKSSEITPPELYKERRKFLQLTAALAAGSMLPGITATALAERKKLDGVKPSEFSTDEPLTPYEDVTSYNNFYEFGTGKDDPARNAHTLKPHPWTVTVEGECEKPGQYALEDILKPQTMEERIYRLRCVEAWSMVIPWVGISMAGVLKRFQPTSNAKFVEFKTLYDPEQMPAQNRPILNWPYIEGLRIDEAMNPLAIFAVGLYGEALPNQNGAPLRLIVPWKYGFKSIKSIVNIRFSETAPVNTWQDLLPNEYGFYANVNPEVDHPRWSQARERRIGEFFRRPTLPFNGYAEQVAHLYAGMDAKKLF